MVRLVVVLGILGMVAGCNRPSTMAEAESQAIRRVMQDYDTRRLASEPDQVYRFLQQGGSSESAVNLLMERR
nr:hypothetical protein [uncultured Holophaga sp.]